MSIPPVALLYATHLIVIIAGDRLDKINTVLPVGLTVMEDTDVPAPEPVGPDVTAVEPADGPEEKTADAQAEEKPKPGKTGRRGKAGADDEAWLAWIDELTAKGENPTASKAVDAGLAASGSTAKRYLARIRREHSERF